MYTLGQSAALGVVQGLTEFLPISSSAHLRLMPWFFNWPAPENEQAFDVALHIGTLAALVLFFFFDWLQIVAHYIGDIRQGRWKGGTTGGLLPKIAVCCVPAAVVGLLFEKQIESFFYHDERNIWWLAVTMALFGLGLMLSERYGKQDRDVKQITYRDALIIGCFQALALIPGTSRSGITILAALLLGLNRPAAARFSFLAALPITFGAVLVKLGDLKGAESWTPIWVGILTAAVSGMIAIKFLLRYVQTRRYDIFAYYRWAVAVVIVAVYLGRLEKAPAAAPEPAASGPAPAAWVLPARETAVAVAMVP